MTHPNKDILIAIANGEEIEWRYKNGPWKVVQQIEYAYELFFPQDYPDYSFRIKPKKVMIRHAKYKDGSTVFVFTKNFNKFEDIASSAVEKSGDLVWLDEWHEASFGPEGSNG